MEELQQLILNCKQKLSVIEYHINLQYDHEKERLTKELCLELYRNKLHFSRHNDSFCILYENGLLHGFRIGDKNYRTINEILFSIDNFIDNGSVIFYKSSGIQLFKSITLSIDQVPYKKYLPMQFGKFYEFIAFSIYRVPYIKYVPVRIVESLWCTNKTHGFQSLIYHNYCGQLYDQYWNMIKSFKLIPNGNFTFKIKNEKVIQDICKNYLHIQTDKIAVIIR
jgi:hypothetical protein